MLKRVGVALVSLASVTVFATDAWSSPSSVSGKAADQTIAPGRIDKTSDPLGSVKRPPSTNPLPGCGPTSGCRASLEVGEGDETKWLELILNADEQATLAKAFATAKLEHTPHIHLRNTGTILEFRADTSAVEGPDALKYKGVLKIDDVPVRVIPEGTAFDVLSGRAKPPKQ